MGNFQSAIILKRDVYFKGTIGDHGLLLDQLNIIDNEKNARSLFVRVMLYPVGDITLSNLENWKFVVDQDIIPDWFVKDYEKKRLIRRMREVYQNDDNLQLVLLRKNLRFLSNIKNPSEKILVLLLKQNGLGIQYLENPSEKLQLIAVKQNGNAIKFIKNPSDIVQIEAVKSRKSSFKHIRKPTKKVVDLYKQI